MVREGGLDCWVGGVREMMQILSGVGTFRFYLKNKKKFLGDSEETNGVADPHMKAITLAVVQRIPKAEITNPIWKILGLLFWGLVVNNMH